jgi:hypothetical protein
MAKIAGTLSMAKTTSITSITTNATNSGVVAVWHYKTFHGRYDLKSALSFKTKNKGFFRFKFLISGSKQHFHCRENGRNQRGRLPRKIY